MFKFLSLIVIFLCCHTHASLVTHQSIDIENNAVFADSFKTYWQTHLSGASPIVTYEEDPFHQIDTGKAKLNLLSIMFELQSETIFSVYAGLDAHYGAEIYINNALVHTKYEDLWWKTNWSNKDVIKIENTLLPAAENVIEIFWAESCCNGPNSVMFSFDDAQSQYLSTASLKLAIPAKVEAPPGLSFVIIGLLGLLLFKTKK
ncbi:CCXG family PEP-CTERM protein [Paraglaciecola sp.]|uniref:CCXG family PEP-CTERM protein n=1 Tax=Paraglaciecola sp. TaxID=1920173 RepID=UPI003EF4546D